MLYNCMASRVTVGSDSGVQKTLTGKQADKVKAGVQKHLDRGDAAPIKPGRPMTSRRGKAPNKGGVELVRGDVSFDENIKIARLALAERVLEAVDKETAEVNRRFFANLPPSAAQRSKKALITSAKNKGKDFDKIAQRDGESTEDSSIEDSSIEESISKARLALAEAALRLLKEGPARQARRAARKKAHVYKGRSADAAAANTGDNFELSDEVRARGEHADNAASAAARRRGANQSDVMDAGNEARYKAYGRATDGKRTDLPASTNQEKSRS